MIDGAIDEAVSAEPEVSRSVRLAAWAVGSLFVAYLLSPMLSPVHPEGFTASIASLGIHLREGSLADFDRINPLNVEFFGLSKLGWLLLTSALTGIGLSASQAMTLLTWVSAAALAAGTVLLVRRWTAAPYWAAAAPLILFPGFSETAFFFNDNIIASALAIWALCALYLENRLLGAALCGALFAAAVLTRTDTVLVSAAVPLILLQSDRAVRAVAASLSVAAATGGFLLFGTLAAFNASVVDIFTVARAAMSAWADRPPPSAILELLFFLGIPGALLVAGGGVLLVSQRAWVKAAWLALVPLIFIGILRTQIWEVRQLLPLTPFFAALASTFLTKLATAKSSNGKLQIASIIGVTIAGLFGPITGLLSADGPRVLTGRFANIQQWRVWQENVDRDFGLLRSLAGVPAGKTRIVLTDHWNDDRYLHLAAQEAGFRLTPPTRECARIAEQFMDGSRRLIHIRLHQVYLPYWRRLSGERLRRWGLPCINSVRYDEVALVASKGRLDVLLGKTDYKTIASRPPAPFDDSGTLKSAYLSRSQLSALAKEYDTLGEATAANVPIHMPSIEVAATVGRRRTQFGQRVEN